jgi:hypothetical protein
VAVGTAIVVAASALVAVASATVVPSFAFPAFQFGILCSASLPTLCCVSFPRIFCSCLSRLLTISEGLLFLRFGLSFSGLLLVSSFFASVLLLSFFSFVFVS